MKTNYYDVHVFFSRNEGYSIGVKIETNEEFLTDDEVIEYCVKNGLFEENSDARLVDSVDEIDENEYLMLI